MGSTFASIKDPSRTHASSCCSQACAKVTPEACGAVIVVAPGLGPPQERLRFTGLLFCFFVFSRFLEIKFLFVAQAAPEFTVLLLLPVCWD